MEKFNISFSGETLPGYKLEAIKRRFGAHFNIEESHRVDAFFTGKEITLRRNLSKTEAAGIFVQLRQIGVVCHIERVEPEEILLATAEAEAAEAEATATTTAPRRRRRQAGAPNLFDLQISARAGTDAHNVSVNNTLTMAPIMAAAILLLAFCLVGLRFWAESRAELDSGLGTVAIDPRQQPVIQVGDQLLFHDRAGIATKDIALSTFGLPAGTAFDFFSNGDLLFLQREPASTLPGWLQQWLGTDTGSNGSLLRCRPGSKQCVTLYTGLGPAAFLIDRRTDQVYLADADADSLRKLDAEGKTVASHVIELTDPLHLQLQEGILYLTQAGMDTVLVLKPDDQEFGSTLDEIHLQVSDASQSGHIYPGAIAWLNGHWWAIMQSRDGSAAGLYLFSPRWQAQERVALVDNALPGALTRWSAKMLVSDHSGESIYRYDAAGRAEKNFTSQSMTSGLEERKSRLGFTSALQVAILLTLLVTAAALLALGLLQSLRGKVYLAPVEGDECDFDINSEDIDWLDPAPGLEKKMRLTGYGIAGLATLLLLGAFIAQFSIWTMIAISLVLAGCGGYYFALQKASGCHLGLLDGKLIVVDHTNTYRVGSGPRIQYFDNFIMIDDVIVYLGNPLLHQFADQALREKFQPVVYTGIRVDRTTLQVKLIQSRHPMLLGLLGLLAAISCALVLMLLT